MAVVASLIVLICLTTAILGVSYRNSINPRGVVIHHSAVPYRIERPEDVDIIAKMHENRGFSILCWGKIYNIGYHYIILHDGTIVQGRPENCQGAHAVGYNSFIGICLIGDFSEADNFSETKGFKNPTEKQLNSLKSLTDRLRDRYGFSVHSILPHNTVEPRTECPGENFPVADFMRIVKQ